MRRQYSFHVYLTHVRRASQPEPRHSSTKWYSYRVGSFVVNVLLLLPYLFLPMRGQA